MKKQNKIIVTLIFLSFATIAHGSFSLQKMPKQKTCSVIRSLCQHQSTYNKYHCPYRSGLLQQMAILLSEVIPTDDHNNDISAIRGCLHSNNLHLAPRLFKHCELEYPDKYAHKVQQIKKLAAEFSRIETSKK